MKLDFFLLLFWAFQALDYKSPVEVSLLGAFMAGMFIAKVCHRITTTTNGVSVI